MDHVESKPLTKQCSPHVGSSGKLSTILLSDCAFIDRLLDGKRTTSSFDSPVRWHEWKKKQLPTQLSRALRFGKVRALQKEQR
jgi:hypothetical protein